MQGLLRRAGDAARGLGYVFVQRELVVITRRDAASGWAWASSLAGGGESGSPSGVESYVAMKGGGEYNRLARHQAAAALALVQRVDRAVRGQRGALELRDGEPYAVADLGSGGGANTAPLAAAAVAAARAAFGEGRPVTITHTDLPSNDWRALFAEAAPAYRAAAGGGGVYTYGSGRTFHEQNFPDGSLSLAYSSTALHWVSSAAWRFTDGCDWWLDRGAGGEDGGAGGAAARLAAHRAAAAGQWAALLAARARELRRGGVLAFAVPVGDPRGDPRRDFTLWQITDQTGAAVRSLVAEGRLAAREADKMVLPVAYRSVDELVAPLADPALGLRLAAPVEVAEIASPFYAAWRRHGDAARFARDYTAAWRAVAEGLVRAGLRGRPAAEADALEAETWARVEAAVFAAGPEHYASDFWQATAVLEKG